MGALTLEGVSKSYGEVTALADLSLEVADGELLTLVGPSGSGKSTALRVVAGLEDVDTGRVRVGERDVTRVRAADRDVGMVFQSFALFPHLSVAGNVGFGLAARGVAAAEREQAVREAAARVGIEPLLGRRPAQLSGGERQRVALARALARRPAVLLLDEPPSNLDAPLRVQTRAELRRLHGEVGTTTVHVTHDQAEALSLGQRVAVLADGVLQQVGEPRAVYDRPANTFVARFLGSPPMNLVTARASGGALVAGSVRLPLPPGPGLGEGEEVVAGFRAEEVHLVGEGRDGFDAVVEQVEEAGHERLWHVRAGEERLACRPARAERAREGERVRLGVVPGAVRLFDPASGAAR